MIGRFLIKNHHNLLKLKNAGLLNVLPRRNVLKIIEKLDHYPGHGKEIYRFRDMPQDRNDFWWTILLMSSFVFGSSATVYMNWDEIKLADPPGYHEDLSRFTDEELGIPKDDELGYAPLKPELVKDGKLLDIGNTFRSENKLVYHVYMVRHKLPNPYDM